jgi:hypothetical protein
LKNILIFDSAPEHRKALKCRLRARFGWKTKFKCYNQTDVFSKEIPNQALVAFFTLSNAYDLEAAFKLGAIRCWTPMIAISEEGAESNEYCYRSYEFGTCKYYLTRPFSDKSLARALELCAEWVARKRY